MYPVLYLEHSSCFVNYMVIVTEILRQVTPDGPEPLIFLSHCVLVNNLTKLIMSSDSTFFFSNKHSQESSQQVVWRVGQGKHGH